MSIHKRGLGNLPVSAKNITSSLAALIVHSVDVEGNYASPAGGGSTQVSIREFLSSSGGSLIDSTNVSLGVTIREGGGAGVQYTDGDTDASVTGTALIFENSSNTLRPVTVSRGLPVNVVAGHSTTVNVSSLAGAVVTRSSAASMLVSVYQSTAADLNVTVANPASTTVQVSSVGGAVVMRSSAASALVSVYQSTAADLNVTVAGYSTTSNVSSVAGRVAVDQNSTVWQVQVGGIVTSVILDNLAQSIQSSTRSVGTNSTMRGLAVRSILPDSTWASGQAGAAGDNTIISSAATGIYVYALTVSPISTAAQLMRFMNGSTSEMWRARAVAPSTIGMQGYSYTLAVSPPAYLFRTAAGNPLVFNVTSSGVSYSVSAWRE